jgi:hypothetical protein
MATQEQRPKRTVFLDTNLKPIPPGHSMVVGRLSLDQSLPGWGRIGRIHLTVFHHPNGELWVTDLASTNGTWLNGERLPSGVLVKIDLSLDNTILVSEVPGATVGIKHLRYTFPPGADPKIFAAVSAADRTRLPIPVGMSIEELLAGLEDTDYYWIVIGGNGVPLDVDFTIVNANRTIEHTINDPGGGEKPVASPNSPLPPPAAEGRGPDADDRIA